MKMNTVAMMFCAMSALMLAMPDASAATIRVQCEKRTNRAKASVDGKGLAAGAYTAQIVSGAQTAQSLPETAQRGEVEFDFKSNKSNEVENEPGESVTTVPADFIADDGQLTGKILDASGATVASDTVACRVKKRK